VHAHARTRTHARTHAHTHARTHARTHASNDSSEQNDKLTLSCHGFEYAHADMATRTSYPACLVATPEHGRLASSTPPTLTGTRAEGERCGGGATEGRIRFGDELGLGKARPVGLGAADLRGLPQRVGRGLVLDLVVAHFRAARPAATAKRAVR